MGETTFKYCNTEILCWRRPFSLASSRQNILIFLLWIYDHTFTMTTGLQGNRFLWNCSSSKKRATILAMIWGRLNAAERKAPNARMKEKVSRTEMSTNAHHVRCYPWEKFRLHYFKKIPKHFCLHIWIVYYIARLRQKYTKINTAMDLNNLPQEHTEVLPHKRVQFQEVR